MIQNSTSSNSNIFELFPTYNLGMGEVVKKQEATNVLEQKKASSNETIKTTPEKDVVQINTSDKKKSTRRKILFGSSIASSILTAGI